MSDYAVQGKLRIRPDNFERDLQFIRERVGDVSNARLASFPGYDFIKFWLVDFAATSQQWAALEPELAKRNIFATMYESPALMDSVEGKPAPRPTRKSRYRWIPYTSAGVCVLSLLLVFVLQDFATVLCAVVALGLFGAIISGAILAVMEY